MKIALAQINYYVGNFDSNKRKMLEAIKQAKESSADLVCFPELATCGFPAMDFLHFDDFIHKSDEVIDALADAARGIAVLIGAPVLNPDRNKRELFNAALLLNEGKRLFVGHKVFMQDRGIHNETRYFVSGKNNSLAEYNGYRFAVVIGEDMYSILDRNTTTTENPINELLEEEPDFIINLAASPFDGEQAERRVTRLKAIAQMSRTPIFYVNHVGGQAGIIFDGGSMTLNPKGVICDEFPYFEEVIKVSALDELAHCTEDNVQQKHRIGLIQDALIVGIQEYFDKLGFSRAIVGLSGGLDSAITVSLAAKALGASNVLAVLMPSRFSSEHSIKDSEELVENLGINSETIAIHKPYNTFLNELQPYFLQKPFDVTEENLQARIRGTILMALSNKHGYILLNTTNKSEMAVGYGTLYGDLAGSMSVLADVYKSDVYEMARYMNQDEELIPQNIIIKPPSAELRPGQKDSDSLPEYEILDRILYLYIEEECAPTEIIEEGFDASLVRRIIRMVNINEFKRHQTAPVIRVSKRAFGEGRRIPIVSRYLY